MELRTYLTQTGQTVSGFAAKVGRSHATISRLIHRRAKPSLDLLIAIERETAGRVTTQDFDHANGSDASYPRYSAPRAEKAA